MLFLYSRSDVPHPRHATYEPADHTYGKMRHYKREMAVIEAIGRSQKLRRNQIAMHISNINWFLNAKTNCGELKDTQDSVIVDIFGGVSIVYRLW